MAKKERKWWESSVDAGKLSMRLRGVLTAVTGALVPLLALSGIEIPQEAIADVIDAIVKAVQAVTVLVGIGISIYGYLRKQD